MELMRVRHLLIAIGLIASMLASAVSACACHHHDAEVEPETVPACHQHQTKEKAHAPDSGMPSISDCDCACFESVNRFSARSEPVKLKHQPTAAVGAATEIVVPIAIVHPHLAVYKKPRFLTDSFYNISPGRAPPRA